MTLGALYDVPAPAKLNLFLHVVGRRADGYHLLQSPFVLIDWADTLHFERRADGRLVRHDLGAPLPDDDLCLRAARALQAASGCPLGAEISIAKRVPWGAGMGGGSSDAASTLLALNRLWGLHWPRARLATIGLQLGADVPFFVGGSNAFVQGIGEQLMPFDLPPTDFAVVKPAAAIDTREIFLQPQLRRDTETVIFMGCSEAAEGNADGGIAKLVAGWLQGFGKNDLQPPAEARCPEILQVAGWLKARFGSSRMTGSGSAVFSIIGACKPSLAARPEDALQGLPAAWVGRMCKSLATHPLCGWAN